MVEGRTLPHRVVLGERLTDAERGHGHVIRVEGDEADIIWEKGAERVRMPPKLVMIEGRFYRNRMGEKVGPLERNEKISALMGYPWVIYPLTYDSGGFWYGPEEEDEDDLVELVE